MKQLFVSRLIAAALAGVFSLSFAASVHAAEETTVEAFAAWQGAGTLIPVGPESAVMVATIKGVVYIQTDNGPLRAGTIICPATADVSLVDSTQVGEGQCAWEANDGDHVFAEWTCKGIHLIGCKGEFTLTGGTGRFEGVTGGGPMVVRSEIGTIAAEVSGQAIERTATGILYWPKLKYTLP